MNRSTTEIQKDMFKSLKTISLSLAALLLGAGSACGQQSDGYAHKVNTLIGTRGVGLTSGYLYPGATYPFGMVQFTPTYFAKRGGFVINQLSGGGCSHMGNFPTFPVTGKLDSSPENILDYRVGICGEQGHAGYYEATVQEAVKARLTVTERTGMARYEYPAGETFGTVIIGAGIAATPIEQAAVVITGPNSCEGYAEGGSFCGVRTPYKVYFVAEFDARAVTTGIWKEDRLTPGGRFAEGSESGVYFTFDLTENRKVQDRRFVRLGGERPRKPRGRKRRVGFRGRAARRRTEVERLPGADRGRRYQPRPHDPVLHAPLPRIDPPQRMQRRERRVHGRRFPGAPKPFEAVHLVQQLGYLPHADPAALDAGPRRGVRRSTLAPAFRRAVGRCLSPLGDGQH